MSGSSKISSFVASVRSNPKIKNVAKSAKKYAPKAAGIASKAVGIASIGAVLYDAHVNGKESAYAIDEKDTFNRNHNQLSLYNASESGSATICKMKKMWYGIQTDFPLYHFGSKLKGYVCGFGSTLVKKLPVLALSAVSLAFKKVGIVSSALLALYGAKTVGYDVMGIGHTKEKL